MMRALLVAAALFIAATAAVLHQAAQPIPVNNKVIYIKFQASSPVAPQHSASCPFVVDHGWHTFSAQASGGEIANRVLDSRCWEPV